MITHSPSDVEGSLLGCLHKNKFELFIRQIQTKDMMDRKGISADPSMFPDYHSKSSDKAAELIMQ